jgi:hypothetical protein
MKKLSILALAGFVMACAPSKTAYYFDYYKYKTKGEAINVVQHAQPVIRPDVSTEVSEAQ